MIPRRAFGAVLATLTGLVVLAGPAAAHTDLTSSSPAEGASLTAAPSEVKLTFEEPVTLPPEAVKVTGRDGTAWTVGTPTVAGSVVTAPVTPSGPAQAYTLTWKVIAKDGDNLTGTVHFTVTAAATTTAAAPTTSAAAPAVQAQAPAPAAVDTGIPGWIWVVVAIAGLLAVIVVGLRQLLGRRKD
ncbi:copper resistance protein CopC [Amycolatopsis sp. NPDC098790]|uniref:copper resistance CopC family protein n=1 Tax=Amycolatopsis sp. NPDC098790 TaxID=3363939 RepID=UPI0037F1ECE5